MADFKFTKIQIKPEGHIECKLQDPLAVTIEFTSSSDIPDAAFTLRFVADYASKAIPIDVLTKSQSIVVGANTITLEVPSLDVEKDTPKNVFANICMVQVLIVSNNNEVGKLSMVTNVKLQNNVLYRTIYDPLSYSDSLTNDLFASFPRSKIL